MTELHEGDKAPEFTLPRSGGPDISLADLRGKFVVLYFYPKDDTSGCTKEACAFRDNLPHIEAANAVVLGISPDSVRSHEKFASKYGLPFTLLADEDHSVADAYGAWQEKSMYGKSYMGIQRSTFLIDPEGGIARVWPKVSVDQHADEVLGALREHLQGAAAR